MSDTIRFHPQIPYDLAAALAWYEEISNELANRFRAEVSQAFRKIESQPLLYAVLFDNVRVVRLNRFPYLVQFRMLNGVPELLGVFHSARDPEKWQRRARDQEE